MSSRFDFRFSAPFRAAALPFGVMPSTTWVDVGDGRLRARFGPWQVDTPLGNVIGHETSGPYAPWKVIGPAHLSLADRGLTFATNPDRGLCLRFREPVTGIDWTGRIRHPGLTVTVADVDGLVATLEATAGGPAG